MGEVFELKEKLTQAMVTLNSELFTQLLLPSARTVPLPAVVDRHGYTCTTHSVAHELAMCLVNEEKVLEFFAALKTQFQEDGENLQSYVNCQTKEERRTALHIAVQNNRPVSAM